jgi:cation:H+ antiporter
MPYFYLILGLVLLLVGGEWLVRGAVDLALRLKVSTLVIGMTVVSFATSAPELLVSVGAAMNGYTDISFGNVVGSNLANIALILGLTALVFPMSVKEKTYRVDFWIMMAVTLVLFFY